MRVIYIYLTTASAIRVCPYCLVEEVAYYRCLVELAFGKQYIGLAKVTVVCAERANCEVQSVIQT